MEITNQLTSFWLGTREVNLAELERYYDGTQTIADNGMLTAEQQEKPDVTRFFKVVNYLAAVVDEPIGYLANSRIQITTPDDALSAWAQDYYQRRLAPRMDDAVRWQGLYGEAYFYLWTDREGASRGLKADVIPPLEGGSKRVEADYGNQDPEELTAAVIYRRVPVDSKGGFEEYRITVSLERIVVEKRVTEQRGAAYQGTGKWQPVSDTPNAAKVLPVVPVFNPTPSDVLNMIPIQNDLDKLHLDLRLAREYYGLPAWATDAFDVSNLEIGAGRLLYGGTFQQFPPPSLQPLLDERDMLLESAAKITKSLTLLSEMGQAPSGIALQYRQQAFQERLRAKAQRLESALALALKTAAVILANDPELLRLETARLEAKPSAEALKTAYFDVVLEPAIPADEKGNAEIASLWLNELGVRRVTAFAKAGIENPQREADEAEAERRAELEPQQLVPGASDEP